MDNFKRETVAGYTFWDLNCRGIVPHTRSRNQIEKMIKRAARRKNKQILQKELDFPLERVYNN